MEAPRKAIALLCVAALLTGALAGMWGIASAQSPARQTTVIAPYTEYLWWLIRWATNEIQCSIPVDHEGPPTLDEVSAACGASLATEWWNTPPCNLNKKPANRCDGVYVFLVAITPKEREDVIELPPPTVWLTLEGCSLTTADELCPTLPVLVLTGDEPLPEHSIVSIQGLYDGEQFLCQGSVCRLQLRATPMQGVTVEFWANSSFGDSSEHYTAQVRAIESGVSPVPGGSGWYVDIISSQWQGKTLTSCARIWEAFPPAGTPPNWLSTPDHFELIASGMPYYYLAGRLISQGLVDVSTCPDHGQLPNGYASSCGLEKARPIVESWQNQFDQRIIDVGQETGVPAQLLKNLFAEESQFWPGVFRVPYEFGLGQITDQGADAIFLWNPSFFQHFCPLVLSSEACAGGYLGLIQPDQAMLRGALALQAKADCTDCPNGVSLDDTYFTVSLFANTLVANCAQVSRTVFTATNQMAGRVATYEDLWRLTVANYHAGPGCTAFAIHQAWQTNGSLDWGTVSTRFTEPCRGVVPYVEQITR
jgi:hypothetical protein